MERLTRQKDPEGKEFTPCILCYMADLLSCKKTSTECWELALYEKLAAYEDTGLTPEEVEDLASVREISPEAEYAVNKYAGSIIERLDALLQKTDDDAHPRERADAVPVVRCKDCKHYYQRQVPHPYACCTLHTGLVLTNDETYCSYGKRKDGASDESP